MFLTDNKDNIQRVVYFDKEAFMVSKNALVTKLYVEEEMLNKLNLQTSVTAQFRKSLRNFL